MANPSEPCPICGETSALRPKLLLIDEALTPYLPGPYVADIQPQYLRERPLDQFIDGYYCDRCKKAFVPDEILKEARRRRPKPSSPD